MYSSSYNKRSGTVAAFENAYAKEQFMKSKEGGFGCTPCKESLSAAEKSRDLPQVCQEKPPTLPDSPKKGNSGLLSGMDGGDILIILLIIFFLSDRDEENDILIPILLSLLLIS